MKLYVSLPSGRCESFVVNQPAAVLDLKAAVCFLRLAAPNGTLLVQTDPVEICGLENEQCLTALALQPKVATTSAAMALWCVVGGPVVTWGERYFGADSSELQDQLRGVRQMCGTEAAFAVLLKDTSVVTWGHVGLGGCRCELPHQLGGKFLMLGAACAKSSFRSPMPK